MGIRNDPPSAFNQDRNFYRSISKYSLDSNKVDWTSLKKERDRQHYHNAQMRIQYNKNDGADERRNLMDKKIQRIDRIAEKKKKFV